MPRGRFKPLNIKSEFDDLSQEGTCQRCGFEGTVYRALETEVGTREVTQPSLLCWSCFDDWRHDAEPWFLKGAPLASRSEAV